jgi:hypothetical protein
MLDYVRNARWVPGSMIYAAQDELVQVPSSTAMQQAFDAAGDQYAWFMHNPADHFTFAVADDWRKEAAYSKDQRLVTDPPRVTFRTSALVDSPEHGIRHDRAYWVSDIRGRSPDAFADTDLTSLGCGGREPVLTSSPGAGPNPVPWTSLSKVAVSAFQMPVRQMLQGTLVNVAGATVDTRRACLDLGFSYKISSDGPATLRLGDGCSITLKEGVNEGVVNCERGRPAAAVRTCLSRRRIRITLFRIEKARVRRVTVFLDGRRTRVLRGRRASVPVSLGGKHRGVVRVRLVVSLRGGKRAIVRRTYRTCVKR